MNGQDSGANQVLIKEREPSLLTARWKRCIWQGVGKGQGASIPSPSVLLSPNLHAFTNPEASEPFSYLLSLQAESKHALLRCSLPI